MSLLSDNGSSELIICIKIHLENDEKISSLSDIELITHLYHHYKSLKAFSIDIICIIFSETNSSLARTYFYSF